MHETDRGAPRSAARFRCCTRDRGNLSSRTLHLHWPSAGLVSRTSASRGDVILLLLCRELQLSLGRTQVKQFDLVGRRPAPTGPPCDCQQSARPLWVTPSSLCPFPIRSPPATARTPSGGSATAAVSCRSSATSAEPYWRSSPVGPSGSRWGGAHYQCDATGLLTIRAGRASFVSDRFVTLVDRVAEDNTRLLATMNLRLLG